MTPVRGNEFGKKLCEALGIPSDGVSGITIRCKENEVVQVDVEIVHNVANNEPFFEACRSLRADVTLIDGSPSDPFGEFRQHLVDPDEIRKLRGLAPYHNTDKPPVLWSQQDPMVLAYKDTLRKRGLLDDNDSPIPAVPDQPVMWQGKEIPAFWLGGAISDPAGSPDCKVNSTPTVQVCDCGGEKAKTTCSHWCSKQAPK
jgi:hypothetical protein